MKLTNNYSLKKPELTDVVNIDDMNVNFETIDVELKKASDIANNRNADTVNGHTIESNVPANAKFTDTVYTHPLNHPASVTVQDANNRFVSDNEKNTWNGKASTAVASSSSNGLMSSLDKTKLDGIASNANNYTHPATHPPTILSSGTMPVGVVATNSTDYTTSRIRNAYFSTTIPTTMANGEICFVYE